MVSSLRAYLGGVFGAAPERGLTPGEVALLPPAFARVLPLGDIRLVGRAHNPFALGKILVRGRRIFWPDVPGDMASSGVGLQGLLAHELAHVWQYETGRLSAAGYLRRPANWVYRYIPGEPFDTYGIEAQADIIQDWWRMRRGLRPVRWNERPPDPGWLEAEVETAFTRPPRYPRG